MLENHEEQPEGPVEIAIVGDMTEHGAELTDKLLSVPQGGECIIYFDSPGGSPYCALSLMTLIVMRELHATGIVSGECSSAALWPLAACSRRIVTPYSVLLFHPMRWQSEESVQLSEAAEWARHFAHLEGQMDQLLADMFGTAHDEIEKWVRPGTYVSGPDFAAAGLAELVDVVKLAAELRQKQAE
ncbi:MAG: ATP-dependent Clp protease proteolytic subunit [Planctomycetaceae bacterium]|nr:ATP-dependent Clp protease proteolytic subunit [Planctomycetales bacterium]MCB9921766.1 ATP-dependent Clp protease proteolytic subunit [Planctomycetaceae bacterium]